MKAITAAVALITILGVGETLAGQRSANFQFTIKGHLVPGDVGFMAANCFTAIQLAEQLSVALKS